MPSRIGALSTNGVGSVQERFDVDLVDLQGGAIDNRRFHLRRDHGVIDIPVSSFVAVEPHPRPTGGATAAVYRGAVRWIGA